MTKKSKRASIAQASDESALAREITDSTATHREVTYTSADGLNLFARDYGDAKSPWTPVVCLAGLTRSSRDFEALGVHLSMHRHRPRRVVAFDYRGRGRSAFDRDPAGYNPVTEMGDIFDGMTALGIGRAIVVGTSRGGIIGMMMAMTRRSAVAGLVLNDIGPAVEARGLARIKTYVGRTPAPDDWTDAAQIQRRLHSAQFPRWGDADWDQFARLTYRDEAGRPVGDYDPKLATTLAGVAFDRPVPALWDEFRTLAGLTMLVLRGANSDLLSAATVDAMRAMHPALESIVIPDEGHPPQLRQPQVLARISAFITATEGSAPAAEAVLPKRAAAFNLDAPDA